MLNEKISPALHRRVTFIGESIHGVSEFTKYKLEWLKARKGDPVTVVFEADRIGMMRSSELKESAEQMLQNFAKIQRTREMLELLDYLLSHEIPYFGADPVTRNHHGDFFGELAQFREKQIANEKEIYSSQNSFSLRDEYMCDVMEEVCSSQAGRHVVGLFHNLHIKKMGSRERPELCLPSVAELLLERHRIPSYSIGLYAKRGSALHNNLSPFDFEIRNGYTVESMVSAETPSFFLSADLGEQTAYHHAFDIESVPVKLQYNEIGVFPSVSRPTLIT